MAKWILLFAIGLCIGCASQRVRVTVALAHGEPAVSIEFEDRRLKNDSSR